MIQPTVGRTIHKVRGPELCMSTEIQLSTRREEGRRAAGGLQLSRRQESPQAGEWAAGKQASRQLSGRPASVRSVLSALDCGCAVSSSCCHDCSDGRGPRMFS